jgi:hypothetical protein
VDVFDRVGFIKRWLLDYTGVSGPTGCPETVVNYQSTLSKKPED